MNGVLDRDKVVGFLKEVFANCNQIEGKALKLMPPNADSVHSKGYQIHIFSNNNESLETCIQKLAKNADLGTAIEGEALIVFNPIAKPKILSNHLL